MGRAASAVTIEDLRRQAMRRLPDFLFGPMETGAGIGDGSSRNVRRLSEILLVPRALVEVSRIEPGAELFGCAYSSSFGISPIGYAGNFRRGADRLLAEAAVAADIPFILSGGANESIETIAAAAPRHTWFQLYGARDPARTDHLLGRARDCGIKVLVFTVDFPVAPRVERLIRSGVRLPAGVAPRAIPRVIREMILHPAWTIEFLRQGGPPPLRGWAPYARPGAGAKALARDYATQIPGNQTWKDLDRIRKSWPGALIVKGIMHPADAAMAADAGADAVTVSNHGSVKLDCMPAAVDVLPRVVKAVGHRIPVLFDGGIRGGQGIVAAHCLGARLCFAGRAVLYGAIAGGRAGADRAIRILKDEVAQTLAMIGCPGVSKLGPGFLDPATRPRSEFP
jgi:isopentenyl diphosphate isomerase/L-lactate dehydrogenase-like FMN-dependent dehydrogenase